MGSQENRVQSYEKDKQALEFRKAGLPYANIAERLGWRGPSGAHAAVKRALTRTLQEPADELRQLELSRLDAMLLALWPSVRNGNFGAVDRALRVMERRAKLLGLDAPTKIAPTDPTGERPYAGLGDAELRTEILKAAEELQRDAGRAQVPMDAPRTP